MDTIEIAAAQVTGARHLRATRNGQDAAAAWTERDAAAIVVCDGCSAGASSEVGARLGAALAVRAIAERLGAGERADDPALWHGVRAALVRALGELAAQLPRGAFHDALLFTVVAAAAGGERAAVWAIGDGAFAIDGAVHALGPFADNQPPYLAYDLLGEPAQARLYGANGARAIAVATDGALELPGGLAALCDARHGEALRRRLAVLARDDERICWNERRVARAPAALQDDCAIALLRRPR
ncbi:MAG TPA: protein phosphatase 2C domain-containing protein [Kofleriaceae bacterium]|nr:protein phosphatase 2C domain-containing protein [Kofleriaceae bacterium]